MGVRASHWTVICLDPYGTYRLSEPVLWALEAFHFDDALKGFYPPLLALEAFFILRHTSREWPSLGYFYTTTC